MTKQTIAVFGSSEPVPGDALYDQAQELGRRLAESGRILITGGYGGVMEAASKGAQQAGGQTVGVTCRGFADREPNAYLSTVLSTDDLHERTATLIDRADGFIVMHGKAGTLAELAQLWALERAGCLAGRPVVLLGESWEALLCHLVTGGILEEPQRVVSRIEENPRDAVRALDG